MALTPELAAEVWGLFQDSPLFTKWPDIRSQLAFLLDVAPLAADRIVYRPGDAPVYLYLVVRGSVTQTLQQAGQPWLQRQLGPGQFFGQQGLFDNAYEGRAVAAADALLVRMSAANLRVAMEWNLDLYEVLLREQHAGRLRRIPLFRDLSDRQVRWLAQVVEEKDCAAGDDLALNTQPGIWIVDWGQMMVQGPVNPHAGTWPEWGISAGHLFVAPGEGLRFGNHCTATRGRAPVKTRLFYLPAEHANRLIAAFPDAGNIIQQPLDIAGLLAEVELFQSLTDRHREHLAQCCAWEFVPDGQNITTQGSVGHSFVIIRDGAAVVSALDDRGRLRPRNYLLPGDAYGATSLLEGRARDATVRAVTARDDREGPGLRGAELVILDRRDMQYAFEQDRGLWHSRVSLVAQSTRVKEEKHPYDWMKEGETLRWEGRGHVFWLLGPELIMVLLLLALALVAAAAPANSRPAALLFALIIGSLGPFAFGIWLAVNYYDDYYVVTNRRVTRRDRRLLVYEARMEAPVEMVQDVTIDENFLGRIFGFGDVTVRTAAKVGAVVFAHVPDPDLVKGYIVQERTEAVAAMRGQQREVLRRGLLRDLQLVLPIPERMRALGDDARPAPRANWWRRFWRTLVPSGGGERAELLPGARGGKPRWWISLARHLPPDWQKVLIGTPKPEPKPLAGQFLWRKHWLNLFKRTGPPFLLVVLLAIGGPVSGFLDQGGLGLAASAWLLAWGLALLVALGWFGWQYVDYRNDIYVVTDDKIFDIEMKPLGLFAKRREGGLDRVQTVDSKQVGVWAYLFNYGDVIIRTAAADEGFDFLMVSNPRLVQAIVFQKVDAFRSQQEVQRTRERQQELIEGLQVYHQIRAGR